MTERKRCNCTRPEGSHHNPACLLFGLVTSDNMLAPGTWSYETDFLLRLRETNAARYVAWLGGGNENPLYLSNEFGGEAGEVLNVVKKLVREEMGGRGSRATVQDLADEIADAIICLDSLARHYGIDLEDAIKAKFNATSVANDFAHRL